jgi:putative peptidoglycan lipid II flippase
MREADLAVALAWGSVAGSALQFLVQLPHVLKLVRGLRMRWDSGNSYVRETVRNFLPVFVSRGGMQLSVFIDSVISSALPLGAVAGLGNAQMLYTLPVRVFGGSVSAAELPAMSSALGSAEDVVAELRERLDAGLRRIAFFIVPTAMGFLALGDIVAATVLQSGKFVRHDALYVWGMLAGSAVGMLASTLGRLYASTFYALRDTRTPLRFALLRVGLSGALGAVCALLLPGWIGIDRGWGVAGLTASAGAAGWIEFVLLRRALNLRIGRTGLPASFVVKLWGSAALAATAGWVIKLAIGHRNPQLTGIAIMAPYAVTYFGATYWLRIEECAAVVRKVSRRFS